MVLFVSDQIVVAQVPASSFRRRHSGALTRQSRVREARVCPALTSLSSACWPKSTSALVLFGFGSQATRTEAVFVR